MKLEYYAGVPHLKGDPAYNRTLANLSRQTQTGLPFSFGSYAAAIDLNRLRVKAPLLVAATDGVGTKLEIAKFQKRHDTIGIDLVAMSVNDLITCGAKPVLFLDYFAGGAFDRERTIEVIKGISKGCQEAGCALVGGETAIMPGFYADSTYDLAGFAVGVVGRRCVIDGKRIKKGHVVIGIESSGFHSNGYSLLRKVFNKRELAGNIGRKLLAPTRIYVKPVLRVIQKVQVDGIAHVTGGGFFDNLVRGLPKGLGIEIDTATWPKNPLFREVQERSGYSTRQMYHTFNMGIGMALFVKEQNVEKVQRVLKRDKFASWVIGTVFKGGGVRLI